MMTSIRPLPEAVRSSLRSGIFLFDLTRVVEELVFNSLDAGATKVSVFVSVGSSCVKVADDGSGITRDGLQLVGERYATSKFLNLADLNITSGKFGFRGEALASISEVSLLEVVTRTHGRPNGYRKVLKGCKCLYLGIDDDRKDVGTTVVVRDLFYNQPVRRKYMQSSHNKALQSIKKCVLRLALVRPNISFKVVDIESENELLCTHYASSPQSLLTSGFGLEVASSLHDVEVQGDIMKISGYISSPSNNFNMKDLQYVYINSQFVCKGPIHKLLSQLAIRFERRDSRNIDIEFQNMKRSRPQSCPAYILNLNCPRSLYDLTFEPSKTYVQFKDWAPVLNFIEKAIKQFWEEGIAGGEFSSQAAYVVEADQSSKGGDNNISTEADISKFGSQNHKDCLDLFFSTSDKLTGGDYHQSDWEDVRTSLDYLHQETKMFKEQQIRGDFLCQTGYSGNLLDGSDAKYMSTVMRNYNSLWMYDDNGQSRDYFLDDKFAAAESFYDNVHFDGPSSKHGRKSLKVDANVINESSEDALLYDCHGFSYDIDINGAFQKPFLKSCSNQGSVLREKVALFENDECKFETDSFWSKQNLVENCGSSDDLCAHPSPEVAKKLKISRDSDSLAEENCFPPEINDYHGLSYDVEINGTFQKPFLKSCSKQGCVLREKKPLFISDKNEFKTGSFWSKQKRGENCGSGDDLCAHRSPKVVKKLKMCGDSDSLAEDNCSPLDSHYSATQMGGSMSDDQLLNSEWHLLYQEPSSQATASGVDQTNDIDDLGGKLRYHKWCPHAKLIDDEENECNFSYDMSRNSNQLHCTSNFASMGLGFDDAVDCNKISHKLVDWPDCNHIDAANWSDVLNEKAEWLLPKSCRENYQSFSKKKCKKDHFRHPVLEKNHERFKRSFSAPPFHRNKRRFSSLNQPSEMVAKIPTGQASNHAFNHRGADDFKHSHQAPGLFHSRTEELLLQESRPHMKQRPDVLDDTRVNDTAVIDGCQSFSIQNKAPFTEWISREVQDSIDSRTKWRDHLPQIPKNDKSLGMQSQNNILDISSGFLHLAGDSLIPQTISKKCLEDAKVLHQVDKKFIPVVAGRTLAVIDQHAADERIRLEELRQKVLAGEAKAITYLDAEQELVLPEIGYQLIHSYSEQIKDWGWVCSVHTHNSESFKRSLDILNRQPMAVTLVAVPCILGVNLNDVDLLEFLQQLADTDGSSTMPPSVIRVLNLKACRGAIMFGDLLLPSECSLIVEELKHTSLCFQCAHGRPTTVPLVNLEALHDQIAKLGLMKDRSKDESHGLYRHEVSVERAARRLCSAR